MGYIPDSDFLDLVFNTKQLGRFQPINCLLPALVDIDDLAEEAKLGYPLVPLLAVSFDIIPLSLHVFYYLGSVHVFQCDVASEVPNVFYIVEIHVLICLEGDFKQLTGTVILGKTIQPGHFNLR